MSKLISTLAMLVCLAQIPAVAKDEVKAAPGKQPPAKAEPAKTAKAKPTLVKTELAKTVPDTAASGKKGASFSDPPVGAKSPEELTKKFSEAYKNKDGGAYIALLKVPYRQRVIMEIQFRRECHNPVTNFKLVTVEQEIARVKAPNANLGKPRMVNGVQEDYDLPVVGFIDYDVVQNVQAPPDRIGMAVGEDKAKKTYYIVIRHPQGQNKAAAK